MKRDKRLERIFIEQDQLSRLTKPYCLQTTAVMHRGSSYQRTRKTVEYVSIDTLRREVRLARRAARRQILLARTQRTAQGDGPEVLCRCTKCRRKGATLQHPSWGGGGVGWLPFPT